MENQKWEVSSPSLIITKDSGISSGCSGGGVIFKNSQNKPHGFDRAKRAKSGFYQCVLDCDTYFPTKKEAANHRHCPKREKLEKDLIIMEGELAPDGAFKYVPLQEWTKEEANLFKKHLKSLPVDTPHEKVLKFLNPPDESEPNINFSNVILEVEEDDNDDVFPSKPGYADHRPNSHGNCVSNYVTPTGADRPW